MKTLFRGKIRWVLVAWMFAICAVAYLDRVNISVAGPSIERDFHLTDLQLGWVFSAFLLGYAVFQAPGGRMADRFGPRRVIAVGPCGGRCLPPSLRSFPRALRACWRC